MLYFHNLQRARLLKQQAHDIAIRVQALRNNFIEFKLFEMFNLKKANAQSANTQFLNETAVDALLSQIFLSLKFKIIKLEKMRIYKSQSENEHQR